MDAGFDVGFLFWLFLLLMIFLWPQYRLKMLQGARLSLIRRLEKKLGCRVVTVSYTHLTLPTNREV